MKTILLSLAFWVCAFSLVAQSEQTVMSGSKLGFSGVWGGWSYSTGVFNGKYGGYNGGIWGLEFGKKLLIGGLHYNTGDQYINNTDHFDLKSNSLYLGYTPNSYKAVHPIFSLALGGGTLTANNESVGHKVFTVQPAIGLEVNALRFCHIDAQVGYRAVLNSGYTTFKDTDFSGLNVQVNLKFGFSWKRYNNNF